VKRLPRTLSLIRLARVFRRLVGLIADGSGDLSGTTVSGGDDVQNTVFELPVTGFVVVPEPAGVAQLALGGLMLLRRWQFFVR